MPTSAASPWSPPTRPRLVTFQGLVDVKLTSRPSPVSPTTRSPWSPRRPPATAGRAASALRVSSAMSPVSRSLRIAPPLHRPSTLDGTSHSEASVRPDCAIARGCGHESVTVAAFVPGVVQGAAEPPPTEVSAIPSDRRWTPPKQGVAVTFTDGAKPLAGTTQDLASLRRAGRLRGWLLARRTDDASRIQGPHHQPEPAHPRHPWWQVMCLTGVDYFSTLGYQPGIAALAAGLLSPVATLVLVLLTLLGALPIYRRVAHESPDGEGSIAMLERLLPWWGGKLFVLVLLGFAATDFVITMTLSAADATTHLLENPFAPRFLEGHQVGVTLFLIALLGAVFLKGFSEAIGIAVALVAVYLGLNLVVVGAALAHVLADPRIVVDWQRLLVAEYGSPLVMVGVALLVFPKLALGLSGFETGVAVMPLVRGDPTDTPGRPAGRIRNTRRLLTTAALIMSVFLLTSSVATTLLIPQREFEQGGAASGRALAFLAHEYLGGGFGTVYDLSTICILWFAGASAMAGLLNIVPRYLPRYGMAPEWARAVRPLVLVFAAVAFTITLIFRADVDAQGGAYATGVLVLISSASIAVTLSALRRRNRPAVVAFGAITLVLAYTTVANVIERPDGVKIASFFIVAIVVTSLLSRVSR